MQEKFNSIVFKVRWFVSLCWYQNDESQSQVDDSGAKSLPQECIRDDEHAGKQIKQTNIWKGLTRTLNWVIHSDLTLLGRNKDRRFIALWL